MRSSIFLTLSIAIIFLFSTCSKSDSPDPEPDPPASKGSFTAVLNNTNWSGSSFKATYYKKFHQVYITAVDSTKEYEVRLFVYIDSTNPVKTYSLVPNGIHAAEIYRNCNEAYYTDIDNSSVTGSIEISGMNVADSSLSGKFAVTAFSREQQKYITISGGAFTGIWMRTLEAPDISKSHLACKVNGTYWYSPDDLSTVIRENGIRKALILKFYGGFTEPEVERDCFLPFNDTTSRYIMFEIPLTTTGLFELKPLAPPYSDQPGAWHLFRYNEHALNKRYSPVTGSIDISLLDIPNQRLNATFTLQVKDASNHIINITEGQLEAYHWEQ